LVPGEMPKPFLCSEAAAITSAWRSALASLTHCGGRIPGFEVFGQNLESLPLLPKGHSQSAQDLVKKSTLNPGTGGSNEKAISRKRSAGRVGLRGVRGNGCRTQTAAATAAARPGLYLDRLLCWCERGLCRRKEQPYHGWQFGPYQHVGRPDRIQRPGRIRHCGRLEPQWLHRRLPRRLQLSGRRVGHRLRRRRLRVQ